jgi:hypothetical protein
VGGQNPIHCNRWKRGDTVNLQAVPMRGISVPARGLGGGLESFRCDYGVIESQSPHKFLLMLA